VATDTSRKRTKDKLKEEMRMPCNINKYDPLTSTYTPVARGIHILGTLALEKYHDLFESLDKDQQVLLRSIFENSFCGQSGGGSPTLVYLDNQKARESICACWRDYDGKCDPRNRQWGKGGKT